MAPPNNPPGAPEQGGGDENAGTAKKGFWKRLTDSLSKDNAQDGGDVSAGAMVITALFLMLLTTGLLYSLVVNWPACELPEMVNNNAPSNTNGNTNANANAAANLNNNTNANTRAQTNTNTSVNVGAGTPTPTPTPGATPTPRATPPLPDATPPTTTENGGTKTTGIDANSVEPKSGPITGKTLVTIKGKNFGTSLEGLKVTFDGKDAKISNVSNESITARTPSHSEGVVDVRVERGDNYDVLESEYTYTCPSPTGTNLFFMVIFAGALGGCIHAMRSLFWYVGQRELKWSWLPTYYSLPFVGAAMAMLFGLLIFAGLFDNKTGRGESLFMIAVAGLVGMFSHQAALKLTDIANAIFTKPEKGKDAAPQKGLSPEANGGTPAHTPVADIDPKLGPVDGGQLVRLINVSKVDSVDFGGENIVITDADFDKDTSTITLKTPRHAEGKVEVNVKDVAGKLVTLKYTYESIGSP